jgi:hypothetical protein
MFYRETPLIKLKMGLIIRVHCKQLSLFSISDMAFFDYVPKN